ncbi:TonB-dependent receptor [Haliea salexigens]|nr:TonB-dependent receptor [Haliea salexigens]
MKNAVCTTLRRLWPALIAVGASALPTVAQAQLEEVIVTAQKRAESVQDVPIAITAFDEEALRNKQINGFADMRFTAPNVSYTKGNFTGNNFQIRGVGTNLVAASADSGVGVHVNEIPLISPRLFETEYYDIEQVAVLRGPQGTLYGRNSTGGAANMITRPANLDGRNGNLEGQYGNFDHKKLSGAINLPLTDSLALRFAGLWLDREGYTENVYNGSDVDGRDQVSLRASLRWLPTDTTQVDLMLSWFDEDSTRTRSQKTLCHNDPSGVMGCLPDRLDFDVPNPSSQLSNILASNALLGPLGAFTLGSNVRGEVPRDLRKVASERAPLYRADETLVTLNIAQEIGDYTLAFVGGYQDTTVLSQMDYQWTVADPFPIPALLPVVAPTAAGTLYADGLWPISAPSANSTGSVGGHIDSFSPGLEAYDQSNQSSEQVSAELRLQSDFAGPLNFLVGGFWMDVELDNQYWVFSSGFDYFASVFPAAALGLDGMGWVGPQFNNETGDYGIRSQALFGEIYYELTDTLKLTVGARYTQDRKTIEDRQILFNNDPVTGAPVLQPLGADLPIPTATRRASKDWRETTGRIVIDWSVTADTLAYASLSRGYKGGGFNPPFDPVQFPSQKPDFAPEFVDALEIGTKNTLLDNTLQANFSAFLYDYTDMQVSKIVNRTSFNENTDAQIWGGEAELVFAPNASWVVNANLAYLNTEVKDFESFDTRDPTAGRSDVTLLKDLSNASNCVALLAPDVYAAQFGSPFTSCSALAAAGVPITDGIAQNLDGNQLQNAPEWSLSLGAQYNLSFADSSALSLRVDYYWQDAMYARMFNRPIDRIDAWDIWNAQATYTSADGQWYARAYIKNIADDDHLVAMYVTDPSSGLFTNVFSIEPRTYGLALGYNF